MATELTETSAFSYNDLMRKSDKTISLKMATGTYTAGTLVCSTAGANFAKTDILLSTVAGYNTQTIAVVLKDTVIATAGDIAIGSFGGEFNRAKIVFNGTQTEAALTGVLQAKNIILENWSK